MSKRQTSQKNYTANTYKRNPVAFTKGKGCYLWSDRNEKYLDFFPGWGVSNLGHCHPSVVRALKDQAGKLWHLANVFENPLQEKLAESLVKLTFPGKVFFCNSGAEANECALKLVKAYGLPQNKTEVVSFHKSFHGRTTGAVTLTGQEKYRAPFLPLVPGIRYATYNDIESVKQVVSRHTAAVFIEPVQGEGGVHVADKAFVRELRKLSLKLGFLLVFDEVQTGFGRTGKMFAFEHFDVKPDVLTLAKSIGNGYPMGACVIGSQVEDVLKPGMHASTFGGNHLGCRVGLSVLEVFKKEGILKQVQKNRQRMLAFFEDKAAQYPEILEVRSLGLMFGIEMKEDFAARIASACLQEKLIINCTAETVLRIMPALNMSEQDCLKGLRILDKVFKQVFSK